MTKASLLAFFLATSHALAQGIPQLWANNCANCHGDRGQGGGAGTSSLLDDDYLTEGTTRNLFNSIAQGHPDFGMQGFAQTLTDAQIYGLVVYIRELQSRATDKDRTGQGPVETQHHTYNVERVVTRGLSVPWSVDFLPDGAMLIANRSGELLTYKDGQLSEPIRGTPEVRNVGQGGLLQVKPHPNYTQNGWIYLSFADPIGEGRRSLGMTKIVRGKIQGGRWTDQQTIWGADRDHYLPGGVHFGSKFAFDPADPSILFFTVGERGHADMAQDLSRPNGKVHRIRDDGSIPENNPFADRDGVYRSIWSYGHRNPQGLAFDLAGNLWSTEHGPRGGDELNLVQKGRNYGWPLVSYGINYNGSPLVTPWADVQGINEDIEMPVDIWTPSIGASGLTVVSGDNFPQWKGDLLAGGLVGQNVDRFRIENGKVIERERIVFGLGRVRDVITGPDGAIYIALNQPDHIVRLTPAK